MTQNDGRVRGIFLDFETGGLDAETCAILEVGAVAFEVAVGSDYDRKGAPIYHLDTFHRRVKPWDDLTVCARSLRIQGRTWKSLMEGESENVAIDDFCRWVEKTRRDYGKDDRDAFPMPLWAHNAGFDEGFLHAAMTRHQTGFRNERGFPIQPRRGSMSCSQRLWSMLPSCRARLADDVTSLDDVAKHYGIFRHKIHRADRDAWVGAQCAGRMLIDVRRAFGSMTTCT